VPRGKRECLQTKLSERERERERERDFMVKEQLVMISRRKKRFEANF